MEEKKKTIGLGYPSCADCEPKIPERDCVSCRIPFREMLLPQSGRASLPSKVDQTMPAAGGWPLD